ncbi:MAG: Uma2 family endonuclease [Chloroflexota bacterium]
MVTLRNITSDRQFVFDILHLTDDTEEVLARVGTDAHQTAIRRLCDSLWLAGPERGLPWHVSSQLMVLMGKIEGKYWRPSPDIMVHPTGGSEPRSSWDVAVEGVPPFVVEVASPATWEDDLTIKRRTYGYVGVQEYLVVDPTTDLLGMSVQAWHATEEGFVPWPAGADGRWRSAVLPVSLQPEGLLLRVYDEMGAPVPIIGEQARRIAEQTRRAEEQVRIVEEQVRHITELEAELRRLRGEAEGS